METKGETVSVRVPTAAANCIRVMARHLEKGEALYNLPNILIEGLENWLLDCRDDYQMQGELSAKKAILEEIARAIGHDPGAYTKVAPPRVCAEIVAAIDEAVDAILYEREQRLVKQKRPQLRLLRRKKPDPPKNR
jgi:hypothetical protein